MEYEDFVKGINSGSVTFIKFTVDGYSHYRDCRISRVQGKISNGKILEFIEVVLTKDESEKVSFLRRFNESYKLFRLGRTGTFTLKQLWKRITITQMEHFNTEKFPTTK